MKKSGICIDIGLFIASIGLGLIHYALPIVLLGILICSYGLSEYLKEKEN